MSKEAPGNLRYMLYDMTMIRDGEFKQRFAWP